MKKIVMLLTTCSILGISQGVFSTVNAGQNVVGLNQCIHPSDWKATKKWHFNAVVECQHIRCTLIDRSGGVPNNDPNKNTFWENIDWTFSKNNVPIDTNQCQAFPMNFSCDFNTPRSTCAALFLIHKEKFQS